MNSYLIVGAGALGLTTGWILQQGGADIQFLVRSHRLGDLNRPQQLFSYNDNQLHPFSDFRLCTLNDPPDQINADCILLTIDGALCRTESGIDTLKHLGAVARRNKATLIVSAVGVGLLAHIAEHTGLNQRDIVQGTMKMLAYQVKPDCGMAPDQRYRERHDAADIAFCIGDDGGGFFLAKKPKAGVRAFVDAYERSGIAKCTAIPNAMYEMATNLFFPVTVACEIDGWRGLDAVIANQPLWALCCEAQREIMTIPDFGLIGKLAAWMTKDAAIAKQMLTLDQQSGAIDFNAFNRFHHGGKVVEQDIQVIENCIQRGQQAGKAMRACRALLEQRAAMLSADA